MKVSRSNEEARVWFRSERVFLDHNNEWFFQTREGVDVGPYESQFEAEIEAGLLKELLCECVDDDAVKKALREFVLDSFAMGRPLSPRFRESALAKVASF
jgi:uncharacterized protein DUF6316